MVYDSGFPANRQVHSGDYIASHRDGRTDAAAICADPGALSLARAIAQAIREARPLVTLPPNVFMPWRGKPFYRENRSILDGTGGTNNAGAVACGNAEGLAVTAEATSFSDLASFTVPKGHFAVLRRFAAQADLLGQFCPSQDGVTQVRFRLAINNETTINLQSLLGLRGSIDSPFEVSYVVPQDQVIAIQGFSADTVSFHVVESFIEGYIVESNEFDESIAALASDLPNYARTRR